MRHAMIKGANYRDGPNTPSNASAFFDHPTGKQDPSWIVGWIAPHNVGGLSAFDFDK
jgi:hypothetical protein